MTDVIITFLDFCNAAPIGEIESAIEDTGVELIINNGHVTGVSVDGYSVEA